MGLFNLFGGKKKGEAKAAPTAAAPKAEAVKAELSKAEAKVAKSAPVVAAAPVLVVGASNVGSAQVKLRLKLVASLRTGQHAAAYDAARSLADIQAKAGRRLGARLWAEQADRILAQDPKAA